MSSIQLWNNKKSDFLYLAFNQDSCCFAVALQSGIRVFNTDPFRETFSRDTFRDTIEESDDEESKIIHRTGGIGIIEMLHRCNIIALVGGGTHPVWPLSSIILWDDRQESTIAELSFKQNVKAVKLRRDVVVAVTELRTYVYRFKDLLLIDHIETVSNTLGLCSLNGDETKLIIAIPSIQIGKVSILFYKSVTSASDKIQGRDSMTLISSHTSNIVALTMTLDGSQIATASKKGTLIRIFDTYTGQQIFELRRGTEHASIFSINFDPSKNWLVAVSDTKTLHVWNITNKKEGSSQQVKNIEESKNENELYQKKEKSKLNFIKNVLPSYFRSQWSFANARVHGGRSICAFNSNSTIINVVSEFGVFEKFFFLPEKKFC